MQGRPPRWWPSPCSSACPLAAASEPINHPVVPMCLGTSWAPTTGAGMTCMNIVENSDSSDAVWCGETMGQKTGADHDGQHCQRAEDAHDALSSGCWSQWRPDG